MRSVLRSMFGATAQVAVFSVATVVALVLWVWYLFHDVTVAAVFHISMFFGAIACYAGVATGLGYRATERVEQHVSPDVDDS
jgi:hypothetical protein